MTEAVIKDIKIPFLQRIWRGIKRICLWIKGLFGRKKPEVTIDKPGRIQIQLGHFEAKRWVGGMWVHAQIYKENPLTVWVTLPDGNCVKWHKRKQHLVLGWSYNRQMRAVSA